MRWSTAVLLAPALAGCSFIYNPNNLPDPRMIDAAVVDANPCALTVTGIAPATILEGQGDSGSAPALLVIRGDNIVNTNLKVELKSHDGSTVPLAPITDAVASADHTYVAFTVTAHVDMGPVTDVALDVTVSQDAPQDGSCMGKATGPLLGKLTLHGLPELTSMSPGVNKATRTVTTSSLQTSYSMVNLVDVSPTTFSGATRAEITAVSSITLGAVIADAVGTTPGPGGNPGSASAGACPTSGGGGGHGGDATVSQLLAVGGGGGGGGGAAAGSSGATGTALSGVGGAGGISGIKNGSDQLASLETNAACAGGAGGLGGTLVLTNAGGPGGAGGGTLALFAGGNIQTMSLSAKGGAGGPPSGSGGAGGGGGAGGNVLVHTDTGTLAIGAIDVSGGAAAMPGGGAGSTGRVRWDVAGADVPSSPGHRGPAFEKVSTRVFTTQPPSLTLSGTSNDGFSVRVIDQDNVVHDGGHNSFNNGAAVITPALNPGYNRICITLDLGMQGHIEADKCIDVAFLP